MIVPDPAVGIAVSNLAVGQHVAVLQAVLVLEDVGQVPEGTVLLLGDGRIVVSYQFDPDGKAADVGFSVPHALPGMVGAKVCVQDVIGVPFPVDDVMGVSAGREPEVVGAFARRDGAEGTLQSALGGVHDDIFCFLALDFRKIGIQPGAIRDDRTLEFRPFGPGICLREGGPEEKKRSRKHENKRFPDPCARGRERGGHQAV